MAKSKFCTNCGNELREGDKACSNCGTMVDGSNTPSAPTQTVVNVQQVPSKQTNGMAVAGFVVSLVSSLLCCGSFNFISLILSIIGLTQAKKMNGSGKGLAIAGIIISAIVMVILLLITILGYGAAIFEEIADY